MTMNRFIKFCLVVISCGYTLYAAAFEPFVISKIYIDGLSRISPSTVLHYLPVKTGDILTNSVSNDILEKLYATNFFANIALKQSDTALIVDVVERPTIGSISFNGLHEFDSKLILKSFTSNEIYKGHVFDKATVDQALLGLKYEYTLKGFYNAQINPIITKLSNNRVALNINIKENSPALVKQIKFVGNNNYSQAKLLRQMQLSTGGLFSWWTKDNHYSANTLAMDELAIMNFYKANGYINYKLLNASIQISKDKSSVYIVLSISEGDKFSLGKLDISGDLQDIDINKLTPLIKLKPTRIVNQSEVDNVATSLKTYLGSYGYAFATVTPIPKIDLVNKVVDYTFFINLGQKVYIRKINISGNDKTRDVVIRRELRQNEAALYNAKAITRSQERLNLLGYFKEVQVSTKPVAGKADQVDMDIHVKETNTGGISGGIGYAPSEGILLNASLSQANLFGSGKYASVDLSASKLTKSAAVSFTDPYYLINGTSLGYDAYYTLYQPDALNISPYNTTTIGGRVRLGVPVSEHDKLNFSVGVENNQVRLTGDNVPQRFHTLVSQLGNSIYTIPISLSWTRDTTDNRLWPTSGAKFNQMADMTAPFVGAQYYRFTTQNAWYTPLYKDFVLHNSLIFGLINSYGHTDVPFYQNYYIGGISTLPGYYLGSVGPSDSDNAALGGTREALSINEILFPMPWLKDHRSVRLSVFLDGGALWGENHTSFNFKDSFRASYGIGVTWLSPFGPLRFSYALPLFNESGDNLQPFQFTMGRSF